MTTRSDVLFAGIVTNGAFSISPVPLGQTWIVKTLTVHNKTATTGSAIINLQRAGVGVRLLSETLEGDAGASVEGWWVANDGDELVCASYSTDFAFWLSGARLVP